MNLNTLLSQIGISTRFAQDASLIIFVAFVSFVFAMLIGRYKLLSAMVNIYISYAVVSVIPESLISDYSTKLLIFFGLIIALTFFSKRFFEISFSAGGANFLWKVFVVSFLEIMLILSVVFSMLPYKIALAYISPNAYGYLVSDWAPLVWMALPLVYMLFLHRRRY